MMQNKNQKVEAQLAAQIAVMLSSLLVILMNQNSEELTTSTNTMDNMHLNFKT